MTTKMHQKITPVLAAVAIAVLLAIIIVVWVQVGQGTFNPKQYHHREAERRQPRRNGSQDVPGEYAEGRLNLVRFKEKKKGYLDSSYFEDLNHPIDVELVKPTKIGPPPLHDHDIIYDQLHNTQDHPQLRHHSGHFRNKMAEVWDPHPKYEIDAFGRKLELHLAFNDKFVAPNFQVTHFSDNYTRRAMHNSKTFGCFYTGKVAGEEDSAVAVSLCNGMTGYIRTAEGSYHIEPAESFPGNSTTSILHRIKKIRHPSAELDSDMQGVLESDLCDTKENSTIIDDDFPFVQQEHKIAKRDVDRGRHHQPRPKRTNQEYHIEIMIVADKKMAQYHNTEEDLIHYILTLMSHVALLFKDATIGNPISLAVIKIWVLKDIEFTSTTSEEMFGKFCNWQARYNTNNQHDVALLLTRDVICKNSTAQLCSTLGVAEVGSMCTPSSSCAIVKDKGLSTSYTIAHELGHVLSMPHDDDKRCPYFNGGVQANNIMSKVLQNDTKPWMWSRCSKHFVTEFLESNRASCLFNIPNTDFITPKFGKTFPGETFEVDKQCELEFGKGYKLCPYVEMATCSSLWCTTDDQEGCKTQHMPWADGTVCGGLSWCHHGECIAQDRNLLQPMPGGWGEWLDWGPCSRTCGGGVRVARRHCDNPPPTNGGAYCTGRSVKYSSCNVQPCDANDSDFREVQCAEHNGFEGVPRYDGYVEWIPKYGLDSDDVCKLYCRLRHSPQYFMLKEKVVDGTKCGLNTYDICVNGICKPAGCDNRLDSNATLDECGVCGGDNSNCQEISGTYNVTASSSSSNYKHVFRIPKGSSNVYVDQSDDGGDDNYLALIDGETGLYVLNGNFQISPYLKHVTFGGMSVIYSGSEAPVEYIKTPKNRKLTKDLIVAVLTMGKQGPPDIEISYRYTIRRDSAPRYGWQLDNQWTKCNSPCSGKQYLQPYCVELTSSTKVPELYCSDQDVNGLIQKKDCNTHCRFSWHVGAKGHCSSQCGKGVRAISYSCIKIDVNQEQPSVHGYRTTVNDKHCLSVSKPPEVELCEGPCESVRWEYDEWSQCSKTCGGGLQHRRAKCVDSGNQILNDRHCKEDEKVIEQLCNTQKCPVWSVDDWTPCSVTCGKGYRTRPYYCHVDGHSHSADACDPKLLPAIKEECYEKPCVTWFIGSWSECNVTCGEGFQEREVYCRSIENVAVDDNLCSDRLRPNSSRSCFLNKCEELAPYRKDYDASSNDVEDNFILPRPQFQFKWVTGQWSDCSNSCGTGVKSRMVICRNKAGAVNEEECDKHRKPVQRVECSVRRCFKWNVGDWSSCNVKCEQHRQVSCQTSSGDVVDDDKCDLKERPFGSTTCNNERCLRGASIHPNGIRHDNRDVYKIKESQDGRYKWQFSRWGRCSKSCGKGTKSRSVQCYDTVDEKNVFNQYCSRLKKPKIERICEKNNCAFVWVEGSWSHCSQSCGKGFKDRNVTCHRVLQGGFVDPDPLSEPPYAGRGYFCDAYAKPPGRANCLERNCDDLYSWSPGEWGQCSHGCGKKGRQIRPLHCLRRDGTKVKQKFCPKSLKPKRRKRCNQKRCPYYANCKEVKRAQSVTANGEYYLLLNNKPALIHCYKMDKSDPEEFITLNQRRQNFAEMYDKSLHHPDSCPFGGERKDSCDCTQMGADRSGLTVFWKVRLNVTSLRIVADDFTFSRQIKGKRIPYGTAGDCYSKREDCMQGKFSVDLSGTSFRLSRSIRWIHQGNKASSRIDFKERTAHGQCGGYCGECLPDPNVGLAVEVT